MATECQDFQIEEATITAIHEAFSQNHPTCTQLVDYYLNRIETLNPILRAVVEVNPDARDLAKLLDEEREKARENGGVLGALHGIPVLVKDTIGTKDKMGTTAGSYALMGSVVAREATVVERLRKAGAVIMGKASLSEWYKIRSIDHLPNGWCARAGQGVEKTNEYGQDGFIEAEEMHGNEEEIAKIVEKLDILCKEGFEKMMKENELDAMVTPGTKAIPVMAIGGYPGITVPAGYDENGIPFGMLFCGLKGTEPKLIEIGYGFEQSTLARKPPLFDSSEWHED
ncbi:hypothetical protein RDABS01_020627 [Bienertia sinuspersici]